MESNASVSCLEALANTTTVERHASLVASLASVGAPSAAANLLVLNIIDRHYASLIAPWAAMVAAAPFMKTAFVVAVDVTSREAARAAGIAHFAPPRDNTSFLGCTSRNSSLSAAAAGSYKKTHRGDIRILPSDLPSWKLRSVRSALSLGWRVLFSEMDVLWLPHPTLFAELLASTEDYAPQRHPTSPVYNFGFFFAQGANAEAFFGCLVREWDRRTLLQRALGHAVELASDQRFLYNAARRAPNAPRCGVLSVRKLSYSRYPTCRGWVGSQPELMHLVHLTYCRRLSMKGSAEDVCKKLLVERFYLLPHQGGVSAQNLTSKAWNVRQGC